MQSTMRRIRCQISTGVMGVRVRQVKDPIQGTGRCAAWIASVAPGEIAFADVPGLVEYEQVFEPRPAARQVYDASLPDLP